jgi:hypothetical protein
MNFAEEKSYSKERRNMQPYKIVQPYKKYFQKSKSFLYPALGIKRGSYIAPSQTYISWGTDVRPVDKNLICVYELQNTEAYHQFEKSALFGNALFSNFYTAEGNKGVYTFNFSDYKDDWNFFLLGKYSQLSMALKQKIRTYFGPSSNEYAYMDSYLFPHKYYDTYAELFGVERDLLEQGGELCDAYDQEKENLKIKVLNLENFRIKA